jgi:dimethylaniline monooxygenase (N-oxide forming)
MQKYMDYVPGLYNWSVVQLQNKLHPKGLKPEWKLNEDLPPLTQRLPLINDDIVDAMHEGEIIPVPHITEVIETDTVRLSDGSTISDLDAIIFCTGYKPDFSILGEYEKEFSRSYQYPLNSDSSPSLSKPLPRLYQNIFSLDYPDSLAYVCGVGFQMAAFHIYDIASMALAQVWSGNARLPPIKAMRAQVDAHYEWILSRARQGSVHPDLVRASARPSGIGESMRRRGRRCMRSCGMGLRGGGSGLGIGRGVIC